MDGGLFLDALHTVNDVDACRELVPLLAHLHALHCADALLAGLHICVYALDSIGLC